MDDQSKPAAPDARASSAAISHQPDPTAIVVRRPTEADVPGLAAHFSEMQAHYNCPVADTVATQAAALICKPPTAAFDPRVLIAVAGSAVVGSLVMNVTFPAYALTKALYIRDLYVAKAARRHHVGRMLVTAATHLAVSEGFSAVEWTTDSANKAARKLYESCGARQIDRTYFSERRGIARPVPAERRLPRSAAG
ncbi:N-acetyltransferase family protein [Rhodopila sp.]|uniref:GNAT family N-acetyltransferase n=1 Tax=Rhodopila sp. TaxID=2480087 RepID=UPI003D09F349